MCSRPSRPLRSMNAPKSVMFLTAPADVARHQFLERVRGRCARPHQFPAAENDVLALGEVQLHHLELRTELPNGSERFWRMMSTCDAGRTPRRRC